MPDVQDKPTFLRIKSGIAGRAFVYEPGDLVEWENREEAKRLIERGIAELIPGGQEDAEKISNKVGRVVRKQERSQPSEAAMRGAPSVGR